MNALLFAADKFVIGGTYTIKSDVLNYTNAICRDACQGELVFLIPDETDEKKYHPIRITPTFAGANHFDFTLHEDEHIWMFANKDICANVFQYHASVAGTRSFYADEGCYRMYMDNITTGGVKHV